MIDTDVKATIQSAYRQFLAGGGLQPRYAQKLMIAEITRTLSGIRVDEDGSRDSNHHVCVIEAGTGTGKTVAYLLATIPVAQFLNKKVVIATATVALQEQIVSKDLPEVIQHTDLSFDFTLAKGRSRYLCRSKLDRLLTEDHDSPIFHQALYDNDNSAGTDKQVVRLYRDMEEAVSTGKWDGERDHWPQEIDQPAWTPVTTHHRECTGRRCTHVTSCSFFKAREAIVNYDCIVANHDLVLADLALGGGAILPAPEDTIYIFDEGHHLPEKALGHFSHHTRIHSTRQWLDQNQTTLSSMLDILNDIGNIRLYEKPLSEALLKTKNLLDHIYPHCQQLLNHALSNSTTPVFQRRSDKHQYRFEHGAVDTELSDSAALVQQAFAHLQKLTSKIVTELQSALEEEVSSAPRIDLETGLSVMANWQARAEANQKLWRSYAHQDQTSAEQPLARWLTLVEYSGASGGTSDIEICSSPIIAAPTLQQSLWERCYGAVVTSATLTALGTFDRFMMRSGTTADYHYAIMPEVFDFSRGTLQVPDFAVEANLASQHTETLVNHLPSLLNPGKKGTTSQGSLVLFSSRKQMQDVFEQLSLSWQKSILMQGDHSKQTIITQHKQRVDQQQRSVIFGLASFAEGIDLPGDYCTHVIIAKLPFSVPNDPVEASLAEWVDARGGNAFMEISVPDACIKLVQACGRLLRSETDSGIISILDKRLLTKRYGQSLLQSLPTYTWSP